MISKLNADGRPSLWYVLATGEVRGWGYSTFEYNPATEAVEATDYMPAATATMRHVRNADGTIRAELREPSRIEVLRAKKRSGGVLTLGEREEVFDLLLGV